MGTGIQTRLRLAGTEIHVDNETKIIPVIELGSTLQL